ncbi:MAG TPA: hypothetical protein VIQ74_09110, partial [Gemmatimonadaceae bacterium]
MPIKFAALLLALVLWMLVSAEEPTEKLVEVKVAVVTDSAVSLVSDIPVVHALVYGRGMDLLKLLASPPEIRRVVNADTPDEIQWDLRPGDVIIRGNNAEVQVRDVTPRALELRFQVTEQRYLPVRALVLATADSNMRIIDGLRVEPDSVLVRGTRRAVRRLGSVTTDRASITARDTLTEQVVPLDTTGLGLAAVIPASVRVQVTAARVEAAPPASGSAVPA